MFNAMDIQVRLVHDIGINDWRGAAVSISAAPDTFYIFLNADQPAEVQRRTMKHEAWHILNGDHQHPDIDDAAAEEEARQHEEDPAMDVIISQMKLWEKAVHVQRTGSPVQPF